MILNHNFLRMEHSQSTNHPYVPWSKLCETIIDGPLVTTNLKQMCDKIQCSPATHDLFMNSHLQTKNHISNKHEEV